MPIRFHAVGGCAAFALMGAVLGAALATPAAAQSIADFYKNKKVVPLAYFDLEARDYRTA